MKKMLAYSLLCGLVFFLSVGCSGLTREVNGDDHTAVNIPFHTVNIDQMPATAQQEAQQMVRSSSPQTRSLVVGGVTYAMIAFGQRPTGGYTVKVSKVVQSGDEVTVYTEEDTPPPGSIVNQMVTYPFVAIAIDQPFEKVNFEGMIHIQD